MNLNKNYSEHFKTEVLEEIARAFYAGTLEKDANRIPFNIIPKGQEATFRCCEYKERAILRLRALAAFGYSVNEIDEALPLTDYVAQNNPNFDHSSNKLLTILRSACKSCVKSRYMVSEICQGCLSRQCVRSCPFTSVSVNNHRAQINQDTCKNCGKCKDACPYGAILKITVPCEESCPVSAIKKADKGADKDTAVIDHSLCISCGKCVKACPFGAVIERTQFLSVLKLTKSNKKLIALMAPSIAGQFGVSMGKLKTAIKELGFSEVIEVALGADVTAENEAAEFNERVLQKGERFMTTSCCHAYVRLVQKHIPELVPFVSHTATPMHYAAEIARKKNPHAATVFISPCLSKRKEAQKDNLVDFVLSFEELEAMMKGKNINLKDCINEQFKLAITKEALTFGTFGGVLNAVKRYLSAAARQKVREEHVAGFDKKTILKLKSYAKGHAKANLIEVMCCLGGCVGGCNTVNNILNATNAINDYAQKYGK
ncbi:monomeric [FeFe] hydrogenase [Endomicrobium proavitum]|uniref:Fe-hydrogenase large subunit family protein n=1 Tax=Endomicrobium proavitum TaxID=1408281 RepID=A0A0G3WLW4_9BACT|nr:monomeric [FeFe] hydrogenase [Endomicrobium proavitum]AKL98444.1 Fe-hydrogenase large subunit family protein [Endomicrobium proavitum]